MIGRTYYGKPILDLLLLSDTSLLSAVALALLAFDATKTSATDVGYPIDIAGPSLTMIRVPNFWRYSEAELTNTTNQWQASLNQSLLNLPMEWASPLFPPTFQEKINDVQDPGQ